MNNKITFVIAIFVIVVVLIGLFTFLTPKVPQIDPKLSSSQKEFKIEDMPGVTDVKRLDDPKKKVVPTTGATNPKESSKSITPKPTKTPKPPKPLPYPRISINYSIEKVPSIGNQSAGSGQTFVIVTLDIRNYGYKYFDAHPTKFKIIRQNEEISPLVNISTGNTIDAVIPNNSRAKGDLVFLLSKKSSSFRKITYVRNDYTIFYKKVSPEMIKDIYVDQRANKRYWNPEGD